MRTAQPLFDPTTHYRIELRGRVDLDWLQSFDEYAQIIIDETNRMENATVFDVHTDQSGIVGLVRRLHGLGMTILQLQIVPNEGRGAEVEEQH
jgi:hypothetical protein